MEYSQGGLLEEVTVRLSLDSQAGAQDGHKNVGGEKGFWGAKEGLTATP